MKDTNRAIRTVFFNRIQALGYSCYDFVKKDAATPYCYLYNQSSYEEGTQDNFAEVAQISVDIVKQYQKDFGGGKDVDVIANAIIDDLLTRPNTLTVPGFDLVVIELVNNTTISTTSDTHTIFIRTLQFKLIIHQS